MTPSRPGLRRRLRAPLQRWAIQRSRRPPACPEGWQTGPPDFVGLGVQKAGTTWWYDAICDHPGVARPPGRPKELHFFDQGHAQEPGPADLARYLGYFPRPEGQLVGEWTPRYLPDVWTHAPLTAAAPQARFLVLLRDPVERYRSGIAHDLATGLARGPGPALEAAHRGLYHAQITALLTRVPRERLLVLQYERCRDDPEAELARTYAFLGLPDTDHVPTDLRRRVGSTAAKPPLPASVVQGLLALYSPDVRALVRDVPELDLTLWPHFRHLTGSTAG